MNPKKIDFGRKVVLAALFLCAGVFVLGLMTRSEVLAALSFLIYIACIVAIIVFAVEYLVRWWVTSRRNQMAAYQFSLAGLLALTTVVAIICAAFQLLGVATIPVLIIAVVIIACGAEVIHRDKSTRRH